jgi:CHAD domain-containing protein
MSRRLRDLDVLLLGLDDLAVQLPAEHQADLGPLRGLVADLRRDVHHELVTAFDSARYRGLVHAWRAFLDAPVAGEAASAPAGRTAGERIWKAYRNLVKHGRRFDDDTPVDAVHGLRTRVKTLRHLLEAYRSLYAEGEVTPLVTELGRLQDDLGAFLDCEMQILSLRRFAELLDERTGPTAQTVLAMGLLMDRLARRQQRARAEFDEHFARFDRRKKRKRIRRLCKPRAEAAP